MHCLEVLCSMHFYVPIYFFYQASVRASDRHAVAGCWPAACRSVLVCCTYADTTGLCSLPVSTSLIWISSFLALNHKYTPFIPTSSAVSDGQYVTGCVYMTITFPPRRPARGHGIISAPNELLVFVSFHSPHLLPICFRSLCCEWVVVWMNPICGAARRTLSRIINFIFTHPGRRGHWRNALMQYR